MSSMAECDRRILPQACEAPLFIVFRMKIDEDAPRPAYDPERWEAWYAGRDRHDERYEGRTPAEAVGNLILNCGHWAGIGCHYKNAPEPEEREVITMDDLMASFEL
jgi:hypothetical protein